MTKVHTGEVLEQGQLLPGWESGQHSLAWEQRPRTGPGARVQAWLCSHIAV